MPPPPSRTEPEPAPGAPIIRRHGATLRDHAAHLCNVREGCVVGWMVEALPADRGEFQRLA